jgi:hypothetical protein
MWKILRKYGTEPLVDVVVNIEVSTGVEEAEATFSSSSGVKQGDNLAPVLYSLL